MEVLNSFASTTKNITEHYTEALHGSFHRHSVFSSFAPPCTGRCGSAGLTKLEPVHMRHFANATKIKDSEMRLLLGGGQSGNTHP